jgi:hypothetical protein
MFSFVRLHLAETSRSHLVVYKIDCEYVRDVNVRSNVVRTGALGVRVRAELSAAVMDRPLRTRATTASVALLVFAVAVSVLFVLGACSLPSLCCVEQVSLVDAVAADSAWRGEYSCDVTAPTSGQRHSEEHTDNDSRTHGTHAAATSAQSTSVSRADGVGGVVARNRGITPGHSNSNSDGGLGGRFANLGLDLDQFRGLGLDPPGPGVLGHQQHQRLLRPHVSDAQQPQRQQQVLPRVP